MLFWVSFEFVCRFVDLSAVNKQYFLVVKILDLIQANSETRKHLNTPASSDTPIQNCVFYDHSGLMFPEPCVCMVSLSLKRPSVWLRWPSSHPKGTQSIGFGNILVRITVITQGSASGCCQNLVLLYKRTNDTLRTLQAPAEGECTGTNSQAFHSEPSHFQPAPSELCCELILCCLRLSVTPNVHRHIIWFVFWQHAHLTCLHLSTRAHVRARSLDLDLDLSPSPSPSPSPSLSRLFIYSN